MGLHHKLCHVLGGTLGLPHAATHTVVLPYVLAFNAPAAPEASAALARALAADDAARALWDLAGSLGTPRSLNELGMAERDIRRVVDLAVASPYANPRPVDAGDVEALLRAAWAGLVP
jgi:maleylacetate reductase